MNERGHHQELKKTLPHSPSARSGKTGAAPARLSPVFALRLALALLFAILLLLISPLLFLFSHKDPGSGHEPLSPPPLAQVGSVAFVAIVPSTNAFLDGQPLAHPTSLGEGALRPAPGRHQLNWHVPPFLPQSCTLIVPADGGDTCSTLQVLRLSSGKWTRVLLLAESLRTLPPKQQQVLTETARATVEDHPFWDRVQPGESYAVHFEPKRAIQPLRAILQYRLLVQTTAPLPTCQFDAASTYEQPCQLFGQDCRQWCPANPFPLSPKRVLSLPSDWMVYAVTHLSWDYTTLNRQVIATQQPIDSVAVGENAQLILLRVRWESSSWHVEPLRGPTLPPPPLVDGMQLALDPACRAAENWLFPEWSNVTQMRFISGSNPAAGCVVLASLKVQPGSLPTFHSTAIFLVRFGLLLAVNPDAARLIPYLPQANAPEQLLAQSLRSSPGQLIVPRFSLFPGTSYLKELLPLQEAV